MTHIAAWACPLPDEAATRRLGAALATWLRPLPGAVVFLRGELGAGKTTLARALLQALGVRGTIRSPTYTLMEPYEAEGRSVLHLDLYRLRDPLELYNLGLGDYPPEHTLWLVEWPERGAALLPPPLLDLSLALAGSGRSARLQLAGAAAGARAHLQELLQIES